MLVVLVISLLVPAHCLPPTIPRGLHGLQDGPPGRHGAHVDEETEAAHWVCPDISSEAEEAPTRVRGRGDGGEDSVDDSRVACSCDLPHTLRCTGGPDTLQVVGNALRALPPRYVSLLDVTVSGVAALGPLPDIALHGLVVSGEIKTIEPHAFTHLLQEGAEPRLQALGLPGNLIDAVPVAALMELPNLDRLDLSHNRLRSLPVNAFPGLRNLTFLDLSDNLLSDIAVGAFVSLRALQTLRLTGNRLKVSPSTLYGLEGLRSLRDLDLSSNQLAGPLSPGALPRLANLRTLNLAHNQLSSVRRNALTGLPQLSALALPHNMVDVLEDHAFRQLGSLVSLDLANNRIVAVSGASLSDLQRLRSLALQNNFLRALTADLLKPLSALQELRLDDNDISQVPSDAIEALQAATPRLTRLTLAENPLNCDCALALFARWLQRNATRLPAADRAGAVCAAPPHLENGLVEDVADVLCHDLAEEEQDAALRPAPGIALRTQPMADNRVTLRGWQFDGARISLLWGVNMSSSPYVCDALFVYEEAGPSSGGEQQGSEVLLQSTPFGCDSSQLADPQSLLLSLPVVDKKSSRLAVGRRYRFCLVLLEGGGARDDLALVVGCSDVFALEKTSSVAFADAVVMPSVYSEAEVAPPTAPPPSPRISGLSANLTSSGALAVWVQLSPKVLKSPPKTSQWSLRQPGPCRLAITVYADAVVVAQERLNCSLPGTVIAGLGPGSLKVCATAASLGAVAAGPERCTSVLARRDSRSMTAPGGPPAAANGGRTAGLVLRAALAGAAMLGASVAGVLLTLWLAARWRRLGRRRGQALGGLGALGMDHDTGQLYRPAPAPDHEQHSRYVKLQATTKL